MKKLNKKYSIRNLRVKISSFIRKYIRKNKTATVSVDEFGLKLKKSEER